MIIIKLDDNHELLAVGNQYTVYNINNKSIRPSYLYYRSSKPYATVEDMIEDNPYGLTIDELNILSNPSTNIERFVTHDNDKVRFLVAKSGEFGNELKNDKSLSVRCMVANIAKSTDNKELLTHFVTDSCEQIRCIVASHKDFSGIMMYDKSKRVRDKAQISVYQNEAKWHMNQAREFKDLVKNMYEDNIIDRTLDYIKIDDVEYDLR